jgi:hypothetical protein
VWCLAMNIIRKGLRKQSEFVVGKQLPISLSDRPTKPLFPPPPLASGRIEFNDHGMNDTIHLRHRNVCKEGFGEVGDGVDAGTSPFNNSRFIQTLQADPASHFFFDEQCSWIYQLRGRQYLMLSMHYE